MPPTKRNVLVGATVLFAMLALGWMIVQFGGSIATPFAPPVIKLSFTTHRADGVVEGSGILYRGVNVGKVTGVRLQDNDVRIDAQINEKPALPANVTGVIKQTSVFGGGASITLQLTGDAPTGKLSDVTEPLTATFAGSGLLPPEFADLATELRETAKQWRESEVIPNLNAQVTKVGTMVEEITRFVTDQETQDNLRASLANVRTATDSAKRITTNLETFSGKLDKIGDNADQLITKANKDLGDVSQQINARMLQIAKLLETTQSITAKIDKGDGTAGRLVNDPKLYAGLVETTESLNATIRDLQRLVQQWEQEGVSLKLK
jgi:phospholipid/cholesterol/gamma-HCH transport system substrate-binding protein